MLNTPENFSIYKKVCEMRRIMIAPVDYAGCNQHKSNDAEQKKFTILISLILSSRTKDEAVKKAMENLYRDIGMNPKSISEAEDSVIEKAINGVNFIKNKIKYIKETSSFINDKCKNLSNMDFPWIMPTSQKILLSLPGVGQKSLSLYLTHTEENSGEIAIDTHLLRIFERWGWTQSIDPKLENYSSSPDESRKYLMKILPLEIRKDINQIVVGFGQNICKSTPLCHLCTANQICPSSTSKTVIDIEDFAEVAKKFHKDGAENITWTILEGEKITTNFH